MSSRKVQLQLKLKISNCGNFNLQQFVCLPGGDSKKGEVGVQRHNAEKVDTILKLMFCSNQDKYK